MDQCKNCGNTDVLQRFHQTKREIIVTSDIKSHITYIDVDESFWLCEKMFGTQKGISTISTGRRKRIKK